MFCSRTLAILNHFGLLRFMFKQGLSPTGLIGPDWSLSRSGPNFRERDWGPGPLVGPDQVLENGLLSSVPAWASALQPKRAPISQLRLQLFGARAREMKMIGTREALLDAFPGVL